MINKIKIQSEKKPATPSLKQSQNTNSKDSEVVRQLKARIQNLEKSYDFSKQKVTVLEEENKKKDVEIKIHQDEITKLKAQKSKLNKEIKEREKDNKLKLDDLIPTKELDVSIISLPDQSETIQSFRLNKSLRSPSRGKDPKKESISQASVRPKPLSLGFTVSDLLAQIKFSAQLLRTINTTLPPIIQNYCLSNYQDSMLDDTGAIETPNISLSELLFPAFNSLVP